MSSQSTLPLVLPGQFIQAVRDAGYKSIGSALAELIDNAFEAKASEVRVMIDLGRGPSVGPSILVADNGKGMDAGTLRHALQFGWSLRFNQRDSFGRYGMGLPNASLSHARRVEILSSQDGRTAFAAHLDVDEVVKGIADEITPAEAISLEDFCHYSPWNRGTIVLWSRCDRVLPRSTPTMLAKLRVELGRLFRYQLWAGKKIKLNDEVIKPLDPLFEREGLNPQGALPFGPELSYEVAVPDGPIAGISVITVRFVELPVQKWHSLSNAEKNAQGIAKNAGVSVVRAGREIDRGWFFMGQKRKENYDDWWRCEVHFEPVLDELFGVTHTKQAIHPTEKLLSILAPDMERIARELNGRARRAFFEVKSDGASRKSERLAERHDSLLEPPNAVGVSANGTPILRRGGRGRVGGLEYRLKLRRLNNPSFYQPELDGRRLTVVLNQAHPLVRASFGADAKTRGDAKEAQKNFELLILAAARTELELANNKQARKWTQAFRQSWSRTLATFLS